MKILGVANEKGGTGKTILAANLAFELARKGYLVVAVDLDQQADLTKIFFRDEGPARPDIFDVLQGSCTANEACFKVTDNLYLIPGSRNIKHYGLKKSETLLKDALQAEDLSVVDVVIVDHPPSTSEATILGHVASSHVLVVTDTEEFSVENIGNFLDDLSRIKDTMNPDLKVLGVVANRVDKRRNLTKVVLEELKRTFGQDLFRTWLPNNTAVPTSVRKRIAVRELGWSTPFLTELKKLADEVEERMGLKHGNGQTEGK